MSTATPVSSSFPDRQASFDEMITEATNQLRGDEVLLANLSGERTDFIRLNNNDVRQAGSVDQQRLSLDLIEGQRHVGGAINLTGDRAFDRARVTALLAQLREQRRLVQVSQLVLLHRNR